MTYEGDIRDAYSQWLEEVTDYLDRIGEEHSLKWLQFKTTLDLPAGHYLHEGDKQLENFRATLIKQLSFLEDEVTEETINKKSANQLETYSKRKDPIHNTKVFLVHGHNESIREITARFIEKLGLKVIVLHEQPNKGRTIIEKFVDYSDVGFAIILLTGDDKGGESNKSHEAYKPRARQNVILELGFFLGKLGRNKVCALYQEGVEIPSDYSGVLFIKHDKSDGWKMKLAREIKEAGLPIDMNKIFE
jgi:predicted nucleotide-binding protein